jgi:uncharacterized membrane protein YphA (DoxX/SURF4 family)
MTLGNFKKIIIEPHDILRTLMAVVFISAGVYRIFNPVSAENELIKLELPSFFTWLILIIEIGGGMTLLFNKFVKQISLIFSLFLIVALSRALMINGQGIIDKAEELFVFDATVTDFFMHFVFLIILVSLLKLSKK